MPEAQLTPKEKMALLGHARGILERRLSGTSMADAQTNASAALSTFRGAFVTLNLGGHLRGCIGTFRATQPLLDVVGQMALSAALHDPRFPPVRFDELAAIEIEISALTPLVAISDPGMVEVGRHGIYITQGHKSGVLLPQVAVEWGWDRDEFLAQTCHKAGLPRDAWRHGATMELFEAEVFSESEFAGGAG
jgi:AmmeMemoRadiSam system protein A